MSDDDVRSRKRRPRQRGVRLATNWRMVVRVEDGQVVADLLHGPIVEAHLQLSRNAAFALVDSMYEMEKAVQVIARAARALHRGACKALELTGPDDLIDAEFEEPR